MNTPTLADFVTEVRRHTSDGQPNAIDRYSPLRNTLIRPDDLALMLSYAEAAPPGAFVEVGVYRGGSARGLYEIAERQGRTLWLFDTFAGHPSPSEQDSLQHPEGRYADCANPIALQQEMPHAYIVAGRFPDSVPGFSEHSRYVAFAHIDVDLYDSTRDAICALAPVMRPHGLLYFDDYGVPECPGATKAVDDWCRATGRVAHVLTPDGKALVRVG